MERGNYGQDYAAERDANTQVEVAITYHGREISLYRNGQLLHRYKIDSQPQLFEAESLIVFGVRDLFVNDHFAGTIREARIYSQALTPEQIAALNIGQVSDPAPWAGGILRLELQVNCTGRFPATRFIGGAKVESGGLTLDGIRAVMVATRTPEQIETVLPTPVAGHCALSFNCAWPGFVENTNCAMIATTGTLSGTFTVECWALTRKRNVTQDLVGSGGPMNCGFDLKFDKATVRADIGDGKGWLTTNAVVPFKYLPDKSYHIACVVTPGKSAIYINGILCGIKEYPAGNPLLYDANHILRIGSLDGRSGFWPVMFPNCVFGKWRAARLKSGPT